MIIIISIGLDSNVNKLVGSIFLGLNYASTYLDLKCKNCRGLHAEIFFIVITSMSSSHDLYNTYNMQPTRNNEDKFFLKLFFFWGGVEPLKPPSCTLLVVTVSNIIRRSLQFIGTRSDLFLLRRKFPSTMYRFNLKCMCVELTTSRSIRWTRQRKKNYRNLNDY